MYKADIYVYIYFYKIYIYIYIYICLHHCLIADFKVYTHLSHWINMQKHWLQLG